MPLQDHMKLISTDDHVIEHPRVWLDRLGAADREAGPRIVLLDEVSMGLAPSIVDEIFIFLEQLAREGAALLLVEQYVTRALALADYVYLLNKGEVGFRGEPSELDHAGVFLEYLGQTAPTSPSPSGR